MKRIDGMDIAPNLFGAGKDGFKGEIPGVSLGTELTAAFLNSVQEAIVRTIEAVGLIPSHADHDQFTEAVIEIASTAAAEAAASKEDAFPSGTRLLFQQTAAPIGWTKDIGLNNRALRITSGNAGGGGALAFTDVFKDIGVGSTAITIAQMPTHSHSITVPTYAESGVGTIASGGPAPAEGNIALTSGESGGGQGHTHSLNLSVQYTDVIIASKN